MNSKYNKFPELGSLERSRETDKPMKIRDKTAALDILTDKWQELPLNGKYRKQVNSLLA